MGKDGMEGFKKPRDVGESAGFHRRGLPNVERSSAGGSDEVLDEPNAFKVLATDMVRGMEQTVKDNPTWGISQKEIDAEKEHFLSRGKKEGLKVLENELETAMSDMTNNAEMTVHRLALSLAYLELSAAVDEDALDTSSDK